MDILIYALIVLAIALVAMFILREFVSDARSVRLGVLVIFIIALLVIANRAGVV